MEILSKRHLFLTGRRGGGKSTLLGQLFSPSLPGVRTYARPGVGVWLEGEGVSLQVGRYGLDTPGIPGGMVPLAGAFDQGGAKALDALAQAPGEWVTLDEVGYLEASSPRYLAALEHLLTQKRVAAVVRKGDLPHLRALLARPDALVLDLDRPYPALGRVIMASGLGDRYGANKLLVPLGGKPLISHVLERGREIFARQVVVTRWPQVAALAREAGIPALVHHRPWRSDTVKLGLEALGRDLEGIVFSPGDQPLVTEETLEVMALCAGAQPDRIWRTRQGEEPGAPICFSSSLYPALAALTGKAGGGALAKENPRQVSWIPVRDEWELWDLDRPEDLPRLEQAWSRQAAVSSF